MSGSSPLTRGKQGRNRRRKRKLGLIPAHAGKTRARPRRWSSSGAHPRSRGENKTLAPSWPTLPGSSPLTRGKLCIGCVRGACVGLIPAHAGKTQRDRPRPHRDGAHPRSRGENALAVRVAVGNEGSSPLTRGKLPPSTRPGRRARLIPAHAGKTACRACGGWGLGAHPRSRGENSLKRR